MSKEILDSVLNGMRDKGFSVSMDTSIDEDGEVFISFSDENDNALMVMFVSAGEDIDRAILETLAKNWLSHLYIKENDIKL
jgi:hypothetical protein